MEEAAALCDRVAIMQAGRIIAQGDPRELVHRFSPRHRIRFRLSAAASIPADRFRQLDAVTSVDRRGDHFELSARDAVAGLAALLREVDASGAHLHDLEVHSGSLEDVFVQLTEADDANA
jgi:ABC-2 type transport system ATP-binding protein